MPRDANFDANQRQLRQRGVSFRKLEQEFCVSMRRTALVFFIALTMMMDARAAGRPNIVGTWNSWASGRFGCGDTAFRDNGTATIQDTWNCDSGKLAMIQGDSNSELFTLRKKMLIDVQGGVGFNRADGAQAERSGGGGAQEERQAPYKQNVAEKSQRTKARGDEASQSKTFKERGLNYLIKKDYARAIAEFTEAIRLDPSDAELFFYRGNAQSNADQAIADYSEAIRLNPKHDIAFSNRGQSYAGKGDYDRAIQDFDQAILLDPKNWVKFAKRALVYESMDDYDHAIEDYDHAIRLNPKYEFAIENRALAVAKRSQAKVLENVGLYDRVATYGVSVIGEVTTEDDDFVACANGSGEAGIAACTRAIEIARKNGEGATRTLTMSLLHRATMYGMQKLYDRAIQDFGDAIQTYKWPAAYNWRGQTYGMKGDYVHAVADFNEAIRLDSEYAVAYYNRGQTYRLEGEYDLAVRDFDEAIRLNSDYVVAYRMRASAYAASGKYDEAISDFSDAIALSPNYAAAFDGRGMAHLGRKDYENALQDFDRAARISPAYSENRNIAVNTQACTGSRASAEERLSACRSLIGNSSLPADVRADAYVGHALASVATASGDADNTRIISDLSEAIRLAPQNTGAYRSRAAILLQRGDADRALADITKVLDINNNAPADLVFRSLLYSRKGDSDRAMTDLDRAVRLAPRVAYLYILRGDVSRERGNTTGALADFENAIRLDPRNAQEAGALAWSRKGDVQSVANDFDAAIASYDEAIKLDPSQPAFSQARDAASKKKNEKTR